MKEEFVHSILKSIDRDEEQIVNHYSKTKDKIGHFYIDSLLPKELVYKVSECFPKAQQMVLKKSIREDKYISAQMDKHNLILEELIYAFQDRRVIKKFEELIKFKGLQADDKLYAGGISMMKHQQFLSPHLDNSHDRDRKRWRVLNLLYYVTPNWKLEDGGNLELWPEGMSSDKITIVSKFNRLVVMATHNESYHSVSKVLSKDKNRCCVSNYYFSVSSLRKGDTFHVTSFRGWPKERVKDMILKGDAIIRMAIRKVFRKGVKENPHYYKKKD